jgi:cathepsin L
MNSKILFICLALVVLVALCQRVEAKPKWSQLDGYTFDRYVQEHFKNYKTDEEYFMRKAIFEAKLEEIQNHNKNPHSTWKMGVNPLTDRTEAEFQHMLGLKKGLLYKQVAERSPMSKTKISSVSPLPDSVDWRTSDIISPVKDQGGCGSCWTFGTAETVESYYALATGLLPTLSEQQILDCTPNPDDCGGSGGCEGGTTEIAYAKIQALGGLSSEWTYPYQSYHGKVSERREEEEKKRRKKQEQEQETMQ